MAKGPRLWDYLNAITQTKDFSVLLDETFDKDYNPFIVNRMLSQHADCVKAANMINECPDAPKKAQFMFLAHVLRPRFRKNEKAVKTDHSAAEALAEYYGCSVRAARSLVSLHTPEQMTVVYRRLEKGGTGRNSK